METESKVSATSATHTQGQLSSTPSPKDKSDAPDAQHVALPVRDKDSFNQVLIDKYRTRDEVHRAAMITQMEGNKPLPVLPGGQGIGRDPDAYVFEGSNTFTKNQFTAIQQYKMMRQDRMRFPPAAVYGEGYSGWGNGRTEIGGPARLVYPQQKPRPGKRQTPPLKWKRKDMKQQAEQHEELVPVRIEVEWEKIKLRDTFTWNLHERIVPAELFAMQMVEDFGLKAPASQPVYDQIMQQMHDQFNDFYPFVYSDEDALDPELPYMAWKNDEMRILVKLDITIGAHTLVDQFEWDINNPLNSAEDFATSMTNELALSGEFTTAIAHSIREQVQLFTRSLYSVGHPFDGRPIEDADLVAAFLPSPLPSVFRPQQQAKDYAPYLYELNEIDLEKNETILSREQRRQKRSINRRGGPSLPDLKDRQRTIRTLVISQTLPGAALHVDDSRLYKRVAGANTNRKRNGRDGDLSDSDSSDDSSPDSPAPSQFQGTARTRGMRGAASAAQQRMTTIGRSETPEATIHHHETRVSRRPGRDLFREDTEEPQHLWVTLRISKEKLKRILNSRFKRGTPAGSQTPNPAHMRAPSAAASTSMPPPSTPNAASTPGLARTPSAVPPSQLGRVEAPFPTAELPQPAPLAPPNWLLEALDKFKSEDTYQNDQFEAFMKYMAVDTNTGAVIPMPAFGAPLEPHVRFFFVPRIRCSDCPGKLYTPGPEFSAQNFEVHLKNKAHKERVEARMQGRAIS